jgi:replication factor A1
VTAAEIPAPPEVRLRDLSLAVSPVEVVGRLVSLERREVARRTDGARRPLLTGLVTDGTSTVRFSWWDPPREGIERGEIVRAVGAEVREFRGRPELVFTWKTRVEPAGEAELPRVAPEELPRRLVRDLGGPAEGFRLEARVVRVAPKSVAVGEDHRIVHEGLLADRSGAVAFSSWSDFGLAAGEALRISGAYVRAFRGRPQLVLDERATVQRIEAAELPSPAEILRSPPRPIGDLEEGGGGEAIAVEGTVVHLLPPSGVVFRCPSCRRLVTGGLCRVHGEVAGVADLRARLVLDDGTGSVVVGADRGLTEKLWNVTLDEARRRLRDQPDPSLLEEALFEAVVGRRLVVRGSVSRDDFGLNLAPESIEPVEIDLDTAAGELAARLRGPGA